MASPAAMVGIDRTDPGMAEGTRRPTGRTRGRIPYRSLAPAALDLAEEGRDAIEDVIEDGRESVP